MFTKGQVEEALEVADRKGAQLTKIIEFEDGEIQLYESNKQLMYR